MNLSLMSWKNCSASPAAPLATWLAKVWTSRDATLPCTMFRKRLQASLSIPLAAPSDSAEKRCLKNPNTASPSIRRRSVSTRRMKITVFAPGVAVRDPWSDSTNRSAAQALRQNGTHFLPPSSPRKRGFLGQKNMKRLSVRKKSNAASSRGPFLWEAEGGTEGWSSICCTRHWRNSGHIGSLLCRKVLDSTRNCSASRPVDRMNPKRAALSEDSSGMGGALKRKRTESRKPGVARRSTMKVAIRERVLSGLQNTSRIPAHPTALFMCTAE
mmetsp:Transcript_52838/g.103328  ORF Transcript_52838/g.103328 Transcript_52838/m.103328 type:complete len:270 (-) Transcript_52838:337-1146(-)